MSLVWLKMVKRIVARYLQNHQKSCKFKDAIYPKHTPQLGLFGGLADQLDQKHPLYQLANKINWPFFDDAFKKHLSEKILMLMKQLPKK